MRGVRGGDVEGEIGVGSENVFYYFAEEEGRRSWRGADYLVGGHFFRVGGF